jgi:bifunctional ADP-heptose synthase (sugar kinase/adenylyltransferase)
MDIHDLISLNDIDSLYNKSNTLVIGDLILDHYVYGEVEKISPEAPVPIFKLLNKEDYRLGGAGNVASNLSKMNSNCFLMSRFGKTKFEVINSLLNNYNINIKYSYNSANIDNIIKTRLVCKNHQLLRIDNEIIKPDNFERLEYILNSLNKNNKFFMDFTN